MNYGLQVLDSAFEQLDIKAGNSDSEEDDANERVELILEPKVKTFNSNTYCYICCVLGIKLITVVSLTFMLTIPNLLLLCEA